MSRPINIIKKNKEIDLKIGKYKIYVLGGYRVTLGRFFIDFKHKKTNEVIECERASWPVQTYAFGKRAKRIFIVNIPEEGLYEILFNNPETLIVKSSSLFIYSIFSNNNCLPTDQIEIMITQ